MDNLARRQITIPATQQSECIQLRVAAYCRVSTDSADQRNSFAAQNTYYTTLISNMENWRLVDIYADEGITGTSAAKRPDFQRLLTDCRNGLIDKVLVKSISRFARNTKECLEVIRELKALGISIQFEEQHIDTKTASSEMLTAVMASLAQKESESISQNMRWAIQRKMQDGTYLPSSTPFGYRRNHEKLVVHEKEAYYVRHIASRYLGGMNTDEIASELVEQSRTEPVLRTREWTRRTIIQILENEKLVGDTIHQKTYGTDTLPRKRIRNHGEKERYFVSDTHEGILDRATYEAVRRLIGERSTGKTKPRVKTSAFSGITVCGECGNQFRSIGSHDKRYMICRIHADDKDACGISQVPEAELMDAFCHLHYNLKQNDCGILSEMLEELTIVKERQMLWNSDIIALNKEISDINDQSHTLSLLNRQGLVDSDVFISQSNQLAQQLHRAKQEKNRIFAMEKDSTIEKTRQILEILETGPDFLDTFDEELLCELVEKVIVDSNTRIRFRLINGLELPERIERTVR